MMKWKFFVLYVLTSGVLMGQSNGFLERPYLETSAIVDTMVVPDIIHMAILISEEDTRDKRSVEELEHAMADQLMALGIDLDQSLFLSDLTSNFNKYFLRKVNVEKAKMFRLIVHEARMAGLVVQKLEAVGIAKVNVTHTEYSKMDELQLALKARAVLKAKQQAEYMTGALNQGLGKALYISDKFYVRPVDYQADEIAVRAYAKQESDLEPIEVRFKEIKVQSQVEVKFELT